MYYVCGIRASNDNQTPHRDDMGAARRMEQRAVADEALMKGFPVLLVNAADSYQFTSDQVEQKLYNKNLKEQYHRLLLLSAAVYSYYHLSFPWLSKLKKDFTKEDQQLVKAWRKALTQNQATNMEEGFDTERVKGLFELYFEKKVEKEKRRKEKHEGFSLEYALSQVFSPKQKDLFKKKLAGDPLTKTEREYYSRTVKKKVVALANSELHSLSRKLLEQ